MFAPVGTRVRLNVYGSAGSGLEVGDYLVAADSTGHFHGAHLPPACTTVARVDGSNTARHSGRNYYVFDKDLSLVEDDVIRVGDTVEFYNENDPEWTGNLYRVERVRLNGRSCDCEVLSHGPEFPFAEMYPIGTRGMHHVMSNLRKVASATPAPDTAEQTVQEFLSSTVAAARSQANKRGDSANRRQVEATLVEWLLLDNSDIDKAKTNLVTVFEAANERYSWCPEGTRAMNEMGFGDLISSNVVVEVVTRVTVRRTPGMDDADVRDAARSMIPTGVNHDLVSATIL